MSNAIRDAENLGTKKLDTIRRRQDREVRNLESAHQDYKAELKRSHEADIVDIQNTQKSQVDDEALKKEKVLEGLRTNLQKTEEITDKQLRELKQKTAQAKIVEEEKLNIAREQINEENKLHLEEMNYRFRTQNKKVNESNKDQLEKLNHDFRDTKIQNEEHYKSKLQQQTQDFTSRYNFDEANYKKIKYDQDNQYKKERISTNLRQQTEMSKMTNNHNKEIERRDDHFRKGIKDQDLFFEKRYKEHYDKNLKDMKNLEGLNNKIVQKMKTDMAKEIEQTVVKSNDPFYQFTELKPELIDLPQEVVVKVKIPEYSKQDIHLGLNNKEIILNYTRRFADNNISEDGITNKVNKVESFASRIKAPTFLDAKSVKSSYENGVMTYVIKKS